MRPQLVFAVLALLAAFALPFFVTSPYYVHLVATIAIYSILVLGLDIVFGYTGEVSIGHAALWGIGAYTAGVLFFQLGIGLWPSLIAGPLVAALFGAILALPALRVTGPYLAMVTLAFGTIVQILINEMDFLTNGARGIALTKPLFVDLRDFSDTLPFLGMTVNRMREVEYYWLVIVVLALTIIMINRILASYLGRAFEALRDSSSAKAKKATHNPTGRATCESRACRRSATSPAMTAIAAIRPAAIRNRTMSARRFGRYTTTAAPMMGPSRDLRPPSATASRNSTDFSKLKLLGAR